MVSESGGSWAPGTSPTVGGGSGGSGAGGMWIRRWRFGRIKRWLGRFSRAAPAVRSYRSGGGPAHVGQ